MISTVILTKNEERNIVNCLESLSSWVDEIILIDDNSQDRTVEIAKTFNVRVFKRNLNKSFSRQRNFGLEKAKGEWVLFIDADEIVSPELKKEILAKISDFKDTTGYFIKRKDILFGKELKHGETANIKLLRLAKKNSGLWMGDVHETWFVRGKTDLLSNPLIHFPHQEITEFLQEINFYTDIRSQELYKKRAQVFWWDIILYPLGKFATNFIIKLGFMDGITGFVMAIFMSFHSFLVRSKLFLLWKKEY